MLSFPSSRMVIRAPGSQQPRPFQVPIRKALSMLGLDLLCHINSQVMPSCFNRFSIEGPVRVIEPLLTGFQEAASV